MCGPDSCSGSVLLLYASEMFLFPGYFSSPLCFSVLLLRNASETQSPLSNYLLMFHVERASLFYSYKEQSERCPQFLSRGRLFQSRGISDFSLHLEVNRLQDEHCIEIDLFFCSLSSSTIFFN